MEKYPKYLEEGMEFGKLTIIKVDEKSKLNKKGSTIIPSKWKYECICICGNTTYIQKQEIVSGRTKSCGCLQKEKAKEFCKKFSKINNIKDCGDHIVLFFFNDNSKSVLVDKEDYEKVKKYCWHLDTRGSLCYARAYIKGRSTIRMHQLILPTEKGFTPEHRDGNGLNNRKYNLRIGSRSQNEMNKGLRKHNTSGYTGVSWCKQYNKWRVRITVNNKEKYLGKFSDIEYAIKVRKEAEEKYFGEFSFDNSRKE